VEDSLYDALYGPQSDGTFNPPAAAQPYNQPWESGGGTPANYGGTAVLGILSQGIGAWSKYQTSKDFLDYKRYEATNGGLFAYGRPAGGIAAGAQINTGGNFMPLLIIGALIFVALR